MALAIQFGNGSSSRCRPPATAAAQATAAPIRVAAATENATMIELRRARLMAVFESAISASTAARDRGPPL
ncbi:hypothetical protein [Bradyrhizobium forestalis]|uniref:hypothetical protein n=1 Tax=Bradyrhizobium forestalis TaxID=1419263 RepID=UPI001ABF006B